MTSLVAPRCPCLVARLMGLWLLLAGWHLPAAAQRRELPPSLNPPALGLAWLHHDAATNLLRPYVPGVGTPPRVLYCWITTRPGQPERVAFRARKGLCLFLDNRLVFVADTTAPYVIDLAALAPTAGRHLLAYWHPTSRPGPAAFNSLPPASRVAPVGQAAPHRRLLADANRDVYIVFLLLVGLFYGVLRVTYGISLSRFFRFQVVARQSGDVRPATGSLPSTPLTVLFILAFALSFALLVVIVHTNLENALRSRYLFPLSDLDVTTRVGFYTVGIFVFVLVRYVFLYAISYVFDLTAVVRLQYREFVRTVLVAGVYLPPLILLHLAAANSAPATVLQISNGVLALLLVLAVGRSALVLHQQQSLFNLHLFSYLCATEVIPLIVLLKLIVFPYI